jgi:hydroxymethylpyrimidine/phosphomethylpyrimidine kinase
MAFSPFIPNVLSIAGSDPSGGAGIQADLKSISANRAYGMAVITALTAQNTQGVIGVHTVPPMFVQAQIEALTTDIRIDAVKVGMIANAGIGRVIAAFIVHGGVGPVVIDPVMVAKGGARLLADDAIAVIAKELMPLADVITPNLEEAAALLNEPVAHNRAAMEAQASRLLQFGAKAILMKGGHLKGEESPDLLADRDGQTWLEAQRIVTRNTHGTGCTLSSALATQLAHGLPLVDAVKQAKAYIASAITGSGELSVGSGHGPTHHFHLLWNS